MTAARSSACTGSTASSAPIGSSGVIRAEAGMSLDALLRVCRAERLVSAGHARDEVRHPRRRRRQRRARQEPRGCRHLRLPRALRSGCCARPARSSSWGPTANAEMFAATVGGSGSPASILWVELQLEPIRSAWFDTETSKLRNLDDFFDQAAESRDWPYTVAWVDCLAKRRLRLGRGLLHRGAPCRRGRSFRASRARHRARAHSTRRAGCSAARSCAPSISSIAGRPGSRGSAASTTTPSSIRSNSIEGWNRLYGRAASSSTNRWCRLNAAPEALQKLLELTSAHRQGSFLVVLKLFGNRPSPGLMSFPMEGATFALDLPNRGRDDARRCSPAWRTW